jgi:hypothetical protein
MKNQLTFWSEEHRANPSALPDLEVALLTHEETLCSHFSHWLTQRNPSGLSGKMSPVCCQVTEEGILEPSSQRWGTSGMGSHTGFLTLNSSESHKDAEECLLSDTLETGDLPQRFYLSPKACKGILSRAERRGKKLPPMLKEALERQAMSVAQEGM